MNTMVEKEIIQCSETPFLTWMTTEENFRFLMLHRDFRFKEKNNENMFHMQLSFA